MLDALWGHLHNVHSWWKRVCFTDSCGHTFVDSQNFSVLEPNHLYCHEPAGTDAYQVHSICCKKLHNCVLCNRLKNGQDNPDFLIFQFRGAFKKFFKTRDEKELERRWTRINRNGPTHLGCVQAPASSQIRRSFVKNKYRKSSARFLKIMKNPEYSSRNEWSNPNCIDCKF